MTSFDYITFFHADINQSDVEDSFQLASDWIKSESFLFSLLSKQFMPSIGPFR